MNVSLLRFCEGDSISVEILMEREKVGRGILCWSPGWGGFPLGFFLGCGKGELDCGRRDD